MIVTVKYSFASPIVMTGELHHGFQFSGRNYNVLALPETDPDTRGQYTAYYPIVSAIDTIDMAHPDFVIDDKPHMMLGMERGESGESGCRDLRRAITWVETFHGLECRS